MAFTLEELEAIERGIASGTLTIRYADKVRTYRSLDDMLRIRELIRGALGAGTSAATGPSRQVRPVTKTGW